MLFVAVVVQQFIARIGRCAEHQTVRLFDGASPLVWRRTLERSFAIGAAFAPENSKSRNFRNISASPASTDPATAESGFRVLM